MRSIVLLLVGSGWLLTFAGAARSEDRFHLAGTFAAQDSLAIGEETSEDARDCLAGLCWEPTTFDVQCTPATGEHGDALVRFPSPKPSGIASNDLVAMEWYVALDADRRPMRARAVVVVHESGSGMTVGRIFARNLCAQGLHAFLIHLPYYGERRQAERRPEGGRILTVLRQAIGDVRRARDAVAVLPLVDAEQIALQGTSLGGIVAATTAGLDHGYDSIFLMLAGGDLASVIEQGQRDAAKFRTELERAGITGDKLREVAAGIEPLRLAHRADPARTWLYAAKYDQVIPPRNTALLADAMRLEASHRVELMADHYTGIVFLPYVVQHMAARLNSAGTSSAQP